MWKEVVVTWIKLLLRHLPGRAEENHVNLAKIGKDTPLNLTKTIAQSTVKFGVIDIKMQYAQRW